MAKLLTNRSVKRGSKIIVTGGAGFIGSNIVRVLNDAGYEDIVIVDHLTNNGKWRNMIDLRFSHYVDKSEFLECIKKNQDHLTLGTEIIIHMGACTNTVEADENYLIYNNTIYSKYLFDYCVQKNIRFIYASSAATYGDGSKGYNDRETNLRPLTCYGYSKYLFDQWVLRSEKKPAQWVGLKFFNVFGPNEYHKGPMASVVYHGYNQVIRDGEIRLFKSYRKDYGDGEQKRDFIYVKDVAKVVLFFVENGDRSGIFNVGTGKARTFLDLANAVFAALNMKPKIRFIDMPEYLSDKYQYFTEVDITSLREIGYDEPFWDLEKAVEDYVKNYLEVLKF
ncbi:MAG: ADP-glyceromanno-heptose 6-epimerase [Deltaproteobacteria bacterium]|nr:ADP-glyceromanno-heptose 6-epimerase [Deltaproteobacteria bacterium]